MKLNREEKWLGATAMLVWVYFLQWWSVLAIPLGAFLWALGGAEGTSKNWRRIGVPVVLCGAISLSLWSWIPLASFFPLWAVLAIGYGIPTPNGRIDDSMNPIYSDEGSVVGKFFYRICGHSDLKTTVMVRTFIGMLIGVAMCSLAWVDVRAWMQASFQLIILMPVIVYCIE